MIRPTSLRQISSSYEITSKGHGVVSSMIKDAVDVAMGEPEVTLNV